MRKPQIAVPLVNLAFASLASGIAFAFIVGISDGLTEALDEWPKGQIESPEEISYTFNCESGERRIAN